ncbi:S1 family peptidase [Haloferax marisrubri]|uniref:Serine protease n=1 Tax=Haloferax marisrubri TaxID=1544719 RepID=A0A2P4NRG7_9EURY|nr:serine protease [Haloferax marisrubri]POG55734.1 serine protease [Haloferax marisrubri]
MGDSSNSWYQSTVTPIYQTVTRIRFPHEEGHATGFFYNSEENTYLVTNRHVVERESGEEELESIRIFTRLAGDLGNREFHDISLIAGKNEDWYTHPQNNVDIAVIPLDFDLGSINPSIGISDEQSIETGSRAFNSDSILSDKDRVRAGDRTQIVGYPGQYIDQMYDFPVTRNAIASTQYGLPYNGLPAFLTDARMHPGTSGSPVLAGPVTLIIHEGVNLSGAAYRLLGVHSATLQQATSEGEGRWLDLNTAWYAELIEEIIQRIESGDSS